ncbi:MAG: lysophospholipid acyltransferase family protein [Nitrospiraceae bacterium]|nr:lysophospholipid acyltransferase family protein [Nitrospiraceae bacterium]
MARSRSGTLTPFWLMSALVFLFGRIGHRQALFLGRAIGDLFRILLRKKSSRTLTNLEQAFPELSGTPGLHSLKRAVFRHYGMLGAEFLRFPVLSDRWLRDHIALENVDSILDLLAKRKGVLAFIAHFGNWELISKRLSLEIETPIHVVTRRIRDRKVDHFIREHRARHGGARSLSAEDDGIRGILKALNRNEIVVLAMDQSTAPPEGLLSPFFGRTAGTHPGVARIAMSRGVPILPAFSARISPDRHRVRFGPTLRFEDCPYDRRSGPERIRWMTDRCTSLIEERIREYPEQWIWMHNRWKHASPAILSGGR